VVLAGAGATAFYDDGDGMVVTGSGLNQLPPEDVVTLAMGFSDIFKKLKGMMGASSGMKCQGSTTVTIEGGKTTTTTTWSCSPS
jgi:hypothetical protein